MDKGSTLKEELVQHLSRDTDTSWVAQQGIWWPRLRVGTGWSITEAWERVPHQAEAGLA